MRPYYPAARPGWSQRHRPVLRRIGTALVVVEWVVLFYVFYLFAWASQLPAPR